MTAILSMITAPLVMAVVAALLAIGAGLILARPTRSEQAVYIKRITATMAIAFALILAIFAWGLQRMSGG